MFSDWFCFLSLTQRGFLKIGRPHDGSLRIWAEALWGWTRRESNAGNYGNVCNAGNADDDANAGNGANAGNVWELRRPEGPRKLSPGF
jgi:hypothetical protein